MPNYEVGDLFWYGEDEYEIVTIIHTDSDDIYHCRDQVTKQAYIYSKVGNCQVADVGRPRKAQIQPIARIRPYTLCNGMA